MSCSPSPNAHSFLHLTRKSQRLFVSYPPLKSSDPGPTATFPLFRSLSLSSEDHDLFKASTYWHAHALPPICPLVFSIWRGTPNNCLSRMKLHTPLIPVQPSLSPRGFPKFVQTVPRHVARRKARRSIKVKVLPQTFCREELVKVISSITCEVNFRTEN